MARPRPRCCARARGVSSTDRCPPRGAGDQRRRTVSRPTATPGYGCEAESLKRIRRGPSSNSRDLSGSLGRSTCLEPEFLAAVPDAERHTGDPCILPRPYATEARSRTQRPGSLQVGPKDFMGVNVEPPVLASLTLANGETVYVELSSEGHCQLVEGSALLPREIDAPDRFQQAHVTASPSTNARVRSGRW